MSRYVDLDEVVDAMYFDEEHEEWSLKKETIESALGHVDSYTIRKWTPITEKFPEDGEICLVCGKNGGMYVARFNQHGYWKITGTGKFVLPIAWMELPKPYEVEE